LRGFQTLLAVRASFVEQLSWRPTACTIASLLLLSASFKVVNLTKLPQGGKKVGETANLFLFVTSDFYEDLTQQMQAIVVKYLNFWPIGSLFHYVMAVT
jgi:hypothetical protein